MAVNVEAFYDMINGIARQQVQATPMDLTIDATISKLYNVDIGEYKVEYQGNIFSAFVSNPEVTYNVGERVYVLVPQGDFSTKKVILGYSKYDSNLSDADRVDLSNHYIIQGPNWYETGGLNYQPDHEPLQICAIPVNRRQNLQEGAYYEDVGFQREAVNEQVIRVLEKLQKEYASYTIEKLTTVYEDLAANTKETVEYFEGLDKEKLADEEYMEQVIRHLNQYVEEAGVKPVGVPAQIDEVHGIDERFQYYSSAYDYMMISADFRTEFAMPHYQGKYYLSVMFWCNNPKYRDIDKPDADLNRGEENICLKELQLGFNQFNGSPYTFVVDTPQKAFYKINPGEFRGLYRVALMQDGSLVADITPTYNDETGALEFLTENENYDKNNIFCSNIDIRFAKKIDMTENPYYCFIETPHGDSFYEQDDAHPRACTRLTLVPHYIHQNQEITADCEVRWFREDLSVFASTPDDKDDYGKIWTDYTGAGWRPIEQLADESMGWWKVDDDGTLTIYNVEGAVPWKWRFKCVCIYSQNGEGQMVFGTAVQEVVNKNSKYSLYLEEMVSSTNNQTKLRINEAAPRRVGLDTIPGTNILYQEWFGTWYVELADGSYIEVDETSQFRRGPIIINSWLNYDMVTFRVACYDPETMLPSTHGVGEIGDAYQATVVGYLEKTYINHTDGNMLIDWVGRKSFNYTALGNAYPDISSNEYTLQPKLKWNLDPMNYHMVILAPDGATLGSRNYYNQYLGEGQSFANQAGSGYDVRDKSMMTDMYIDSENVVHFKVRAEIEPTKVLNTLTARVLTIADGTWYECPCEVMFTKDGQSGTQGSGWTAPLVQVSEFEGSGKVAYDPVQERDVVIAAPAYTTTIGLPTVPLCIERTGTGEYVQSPNSRKVFIRPIVSKEGNNLMQYTGDGRKYKIVVSWDVRFAKNATLPQARNSSFLRLYDAYTHQPIGFGDDLKDPRKNGLGNNTVNPEDEPGLIGQTIWDGTDQTIQRNKTYCAVEVRFKDNQFLYKNNQLDPKAKNGEVLDPFDMMTCMNYSFVVKATISIFSNDAEDFPATSSKGKFDEDLAEGGILNKNFAGGARVVQDGTVYDSQGNVVGSGGTVFNPDVRLVKTIVSYYPVDIFIKDDTSADFDVLNVRELNWPRMIYFDAQGGNPTVNDNYLTFLYGGRELENLIAPKSLLESIAKVEYIEDYSQVETTETLYDSSSEVVIPGNAVFDEYQRTLEQESISRWKYRPVTTINWDNGFVGVLYGRVDINGVKGQFFRNQVFLLNKNSNVAVNNWDGHSITIDDDNGVILAPTFAAGFKTDYSNLFYGVIMGKNTSFPRIQLTREGERITGGIDQLAAVGGVLDEHVQENYMTGIFGYQSGVPSFGLLENGTAFFGRLDRGGGIIIDGYNATIYGGANGVVSSPKIGDNMWNSMRLTLVDLSHATNRPTTNVFDTDGTPIGLKDSVDTYDEYFFGEEKTYDADGNVIWTEERPTHDDDDPNSTEGVGNIEAENVVTTDIRGRTQGFGGGFFGRGGEYDEDPYGVSSKLPKWYKLVWMGAYIKPLGQAPYWFDSGEETEKAIIHRQTPKERWAYYVTGPDGQPAIQYLEEDYLYDSGESIHKFNLRDLFFVPNPTLVPQIDFIVENHEEGIGALDSGSMTLIKTNELIPGLRDYDPNLKYELGNNNLGINYWNPSVKQVRAYMGLKDEKGGPVSGFGPSRASTTPAIEIGQHPTGLMPGLIPLDYSLDEIFKEMYIPGDRNFMVTYDGTMWAMNGVFLGNVIGSNIIGGRLNGTEIGIGRNLKPEEWANSLWLKHYGNWGYLWGPSVKYGKNKITEKWDDDVQKIRRSFIRTSQINADGSALFKKIYVLGGEVHIGTFHILGKTPWYSVGDNQEDNGCLAGQHGRDHEGHLIQLGVSDFLGPTHFYGSIGIGPNLYNDNDMESQVFDGGKGHLLQTNGLTALGIILPPTESGGRNFTFHQNMAGLMNTDNMSTIYLMNKSADLTGSNPRGDSDYLVYVGSKYAYGDPKIQNTSEGLSIEQMAMFGVYTAQAPFMSKTGGAGGGSTGGKEEGTETNVKVDKARIAEIKTELVTLGKELQTVYSSAESRASYKTKFASKLSELNSELAPVDGIPYPIDFTSWVVVHFSYQSEEELAQGMVDWQGDPTYALYKKIDPIIAKVQDSNAQKVEPTTVSGEGGYVGHFWPLAFRYMETSATDEGETPPYDTTVHAYATTMDIFAAKNTPIGNENDAQEVHLEEAGGANYFRIGPWGTEGMRMYFTSGWQSENISEQPKPDRINWVLNGNQFTRGERKEHGYGEDYNSPRGYIGVGAGGGGKNDGPPVTLQSWGLSKIFIRSDNEVHMMGFRGLNGWFRTMSKKKLDEQDGYSVAKMNKHRTQLIATEEVTGMSTYSNAMDDGDWGSYIDKFEIDKTEDAEHSKAMLQFTAGIGKGAGTSNRQLYLVMKGTDGVGWETKETTNGIVLDPQDRMKFSIDKNFNSGHGGTYLFGKMDSGVHILQIKDGGDPKQDGTSSELFLFHEQASLVGENLVLIGTKPKNFDNITNSHIKDTNIKNGTNPGQGISHAPNTKEGAGTAYANGVAHTVASSFWGVDIGEYDIIADGVGHGGHDESKAGIGIDKDAMVVYHKEAITIANGIITEHYSPDKVPMISLGAGTGGGHAANTVFIGDGLGGMLGQNGTVKMIDSWAKPDNQYCIYARFG